MKSLLLIYLAQNGDGRWTPEIGDPTFIGWLTVACYFAVAYLCYRNAKALTKTSGFNSLTVIWWLITLVLVFLGINKQLDLQSLMTEIGKRIAIEQGWYEKRRIVQGGFIVVMIMGGLAVLLAGAWNLRRRLRSLRLIFLGMMLLIAFIIIRAASFHHLDQVLGFRIAGFRLIWVLELGSLAVIGLGAFRQKG